MTPTYAPDDDPPTAGWAWTEQPLEDPDEEERAVTPSADVAPELHEDHG